MSRTSKNKQAQARTTPLGRVFKEWPYLDRLRYVEVVASRRMMDEYPDVAVRLVKAGWGRYTDAAYSGFTHLEVYSIFAAEERLRAIGLDPDAFYIGFSQEDEPPACIPD
jgi:hypothetical protein